MKFMVIVVVAMVVASGLGVFFFLQINDDLEKQVSSDIEETADLHASVLVSWVDGLESQTRTMALSTTFQNTTDDEVNASLSEERFRDDIRSVHFVDTESTEIRASTGVSDLRGVPFQSLDAPWTSRLDEIAGEVSDGNSVFITDTPYTSVTGADVIAFITSPSNRDDRLLIVEASVTGDRLGFDSSSETGYLTIHDPQTDVGEFVYDGSDDRVVSSNLTEMTQSSVVEDEVVGLASVEGTDWTVVAHVSRNEAFSLRNQIAVSLAALVIVPLVVIGTAVSVIGRRTGRTLSRLTESAEKVRSGDLEAEFETSRSDEIGRLAMAFDDVRESLKTRINEAESARKEAEVSRAEAMELSNYLQEIADEYAEIMQQCAAGDLTERMEPDGENEAMDRIANEFNEMIDELEKTTGQLKSFSDEVKTAGEEVQQSSETVKDASEQVADSIQRISDDAYDQQERLEDISRTIDGISSDLEAFAAENDVDFADSLQRIEDIASALNELVDISEETMAESENVAGAAEEQAAELNEVSERAGDLTRYANPLREVLDRFETESEHEFYFPTGPGSGDGKMPGDDQD